MPVFQRRLFGSRLAAEHQRLTAAPAQVASAFADHAVALCCEWEVAVGARATVDVARHAATLDRVGVATVGWQFVNAAHDQLPLFAVRLDAAAEQLVGDQVRDFVRHRLAQKVFGVFLIQLRVEAQQVFMQMGNASLLTAQLEADDRAFERAFEEGFGLLVTGFDAGIELLGHAVWLSNAPSMP